jgi:hypothetical protein
MAAFLFVPPGKLIDGTIPTVTSYNCRKPQRNGEKKPESRKVSIVPMKEATDVLKIVGMILLALFVLAVGVPLVLAAAGVVLGFLVTLAVWVIKIAIVMAIIYLIVVGIRAVLR